MKDNAPAHNHRTSEEVSINTNKIFAATIPAPVQASIKIVTSQISTDFKHENSHNLAKNQYFSMIFSPAYLPKSPLSNDVSFTGI